MSGSLIMDIENASLEQDQNSAIAGTDLHEITETENFLATNTEGGTSPVLKQPKTYEQQVKILKDRGLIINDEQYAKKVLERINYYRLTAYCLSFKKDDKYHGGYSFEDILNIYEFDKKLRYTLLDLIECVEIAFRAQISYYLANKYGALCYLDKQYFRNEVYHNDFIKEFQKEITRSSEIFVDHHKKNYNGQFPIWVAIETLPLGVLSKFFVNMKNEDKKEISRAYYNAAYAFIESWLLTISFIRNICAHHGRLYDRSLSKPPRFLIKDDMLKIDVHSLFAGIYNMKYLISDRVKWRDFIIEIGAIFEKYSIIDLKNIGFPENWKILLNT
jgi:abortive infection bacteriophage resistance protein